MYTITRLSRAPSLSPPNPNPKPSQPFFTCLPRVTRLPCVQAASVACNLNASTRVASLQHFPILILQEGFPTRFPVHKPTDDALPSFTTCDAQLPGKRTTRASPRPASLTTTSYITAARSAHAPKSTNPPKPKQLTKVTITALSSASSPSLECSTYHLPLQSLPYTCLPLLQPSTFFQVHTS